MPFKWYPGARVLDQALLWRLLDLDRRTAGRSSRDRDQVPLLWHPPSQQGRVARAPVPAGVRLRPRRVRQFSESAARPGDCGAVSGSTGSRSARRGASSPSPGTSPTGSRVTGLDAEVLPPPPAEARLPHDRYDGFVLSVNRLDRYKRIDLLIEAAKAEPGAAGRDRRRRARPRPARGSPPRLNGRIEFTGRVDGERLADLYAAASPSTTRRSTRTTGWFPTRRSSPASRW